MNACSLLKQNQTIPEDTVQTHLCEKPYRHAHPLTPGPVMTLCEVIMENSLEYFFPACFHAHMLSIWTIVEYRTSCHRNDRF